MTKDDLETRQLSLDFEPRADTPSGMSDESQFRSRANLTMVVSNCDVVTTNRAVRPTLSMVNDKNLYDQAVTASLRRYADALGW